MKILIIRFSALGDLILLSLLFRETKKVFPKAELFFMTAQEFGKLHQDNLHIKETYLFNRNLGMSEIFRARKFIKKHKFDFIVDAHSSLRSFFIRLGSSAKIFLHSKRRWRRYSLIYFKNKQNKKIKTQRESYIEWLQKFTKDNLKLQTEFFINANAKKAIDILFTKYLLDRDRLVAIAPGAKYINKCWLSPYWAALVKKMKQHGRQIILLGTENDRKLLKGYEKIAAECHLDLTDKLQIGETAELLTRCNFLVCNDSALLHLAEATGTPVVAIFGPTVREFGFAPFLKNSKLLEADLNCRPCSAHGKKQCTNATFKKCMRLVTPVQVWEAIETLEKQSMFQNSNAN